jgi:GMP synthase-like glutamine amidotransferase
MTERLLVIEHGGYAPAGLLGDWAVDRALAVDTVALHAGELLPGDISGYAAAVSLGSGHSAYDDTVPWLAAELSFLNCLLAAEVPVLGICFGAQALARVLGAHVYPLSAPEIGWARVTARCPALPEGGRAWRERGVAAGVLPRPAHRRAVPSRGDPADRPVVDGDHQSRVGSGRTAVPGRG